MIKTDTIQYGVTLETERNKYEITEVTSVQSFYIVEGLDILLPYGSIMFSDSFNVFGNIPLVGGERLRLVEANTIDNDIKEYIFRVLSVNLLGKGIYKLDFVLDVEIFNNKRSRSFGNSTLSYAVQFLIQQYSTSVQIERAEPTTIWIQPYISDGEYLEYLRSKAYYSDNYNFLSWFDRDKNFYFRSYEGLVSSDTVASFDNIEDAKIENNKYLNIKNFTSSNYYYDVKTNKFINFENRLIPKDLTAYNLRKENDTSIGNITNLQSTSNFRSNDLMALPKKLNDKYITLDYRFYDLHSKLIVPGNIVDLQLKNKFFVDKNIEYSMNLAHSGPWLTFRIKHIYSNQPLNEITFIRKGVDKVEDRLVSS